MNTTLKLFKLTWGESPLPLWRSTAWKNIGDIEKALEERMKFQIDWKFNLSGQGKDLMATLEVIRGPSW